MRLFIDHLHCDTRLSDWLKKILVKKKTRKATSGANLGPYQTSMMERFCESSYKRVTIYAKAPSWMFDRILNMFLTSQLFH